MPPLASRGTVGSGIFGHCAASDAVAAAIAAMTINFFIHSPHTMDKKEKSGPHGITGTRLLTLDSRREKIPLEGVPHAAVPGLSHLGFSASRVRAAGRRANQTDAVGRSR